MPEENDDPAVTGAAMSLSSSATKKISLPSLLQIGSLPPAVEILHFSSVIGNRRTKISD